MLQTNGENIALAKIVVIGTSNSVMGKKGFIKSLSIEHDVVNLSSGRVPFYCHIKTIELNKDLIEDSDLLIIDHYINDINFYNQSLGKKYIQECEYFYQILSTLNTNIINLLFPIKNTLKESSLDYYQKVKHLTKKYNLSIIDLNEYNFEPHHYDNPVHINHKVSYILGLSLSKIVAEFQEHKPYGGKLISNPFKVLDAHSLADYVPNSKDNTFKNSLLEVDYLEIENEFSIQNLSGMALKSIGYLTPKGINSKSGIVINNKYSFSLISGGYFHESFDREIMIEDKLTLAPIKGFRSDLTSMMQRTKISGDFDFLFITDILLSTGQEIQYQAAKRNRKTMILKDLKSMLDSTLVSIDDTLRRISTVTTNALRDAAILLEDTNIQKII